MKEFDPSARIELAQAILISQALEDHPELDPFEAAATMDGTSETEDGEVVGPATHCATIHTEAVLGKPGANEGARVNVQTNRRHQLAEKGLDPAEDFLREKLGKDYSKTSVLWQGRPPKLPALPRRYRNAKRS